MPLAAALCAPPAEPPGPEPSRMLGFREDGSAPPLAAFLEAFRLEDEATNGPGDGAPAKGGAAKEASWEVFSNHDAFPGEDARILGTGNLDECRAICLREGFSGFVYWAGTAYFRAQPRRELLEGRQPSYGSTLFVAPEAGHKPRAGRGRFMSLLADRGSEGFKAKQQEALERKAAREQQAQEARAAREKKEAKATRRRDAAQAALRGCEAEVAGSKAKIFAILLAPCVATVQDAEMLECCVRSVAAQRCPPRTLWVSWFSADPELQLRVSASLVELAKKCVLKGMPVTQVQVREQLPPWRHVEGVLDRRREMGGDVCDVWALLGYGDGLWHPERCARLAEAAAGAGGDGRAVWLPGACAPVPGRPCPLPRDAAAVDALLADGGAAARPRGAGGVACRAAAEDLPLVRLAALAEFIAGAPAPVLDHPLCDLAFTSFARHNDGGLLEVECNDSALWTAFHGAASLGRPPALARPAATGAAAYDPPAEERRSAMTRRRHAGDWALDLSAADFARLFAACRRGCEALALASLHGPAGDPGTLESEGSFAWPWDGVQEEFGLAEDGLAWLLSEAPALVEEARQRLGEIIPPNRQELDRLISSIKPRASTEALARPLVS